MDAWGSTTGFHQSDLWRRDDSDDGSGSGQGFSFSGNDTSESAFINELRFQAAKSIRTSTIILAAFNVVAAFATAVGIAWDSYATKKRNDPSFKLRTSGFSFVAPTETYPLAMSIGIVFQGIIFAVAQSTGLESMLTLGCAVTSQFMLPALLVVPYIQFIFGLEITLRSLRRRTPFSSRGKWTVPACLAVLVIFLLVTFLVAHFLTPPNFCFASLFWFVQRWKEGILVILIIIAAALLVCVPVLFWKLHTICNVPYTERVVGSRMIYFLSLAVISITLQIPFFYSIVFMDLRTSGPMPLNLSMIAAVVANLSGLMTGGLHLFLRANCLSTIGPREKCESDHKRFKEGIRVQSPTKDFYTAGDGSASAAADFDEKLSGHRASFASSTYGKEEDRIESPFGTPTYENSDPLRRPTVYSTAPMPRISEPRRPSKVETLKAHIRKSSASFFKQEGGNKSYGLLPATTYSPRESGEKEEEAGAGMDSLLPPPPIHGARHRRGSSTGSHATVQIGMRFSNAKDAPRLNSQYVAQVHDLGSPDERESTVSKCPSPLAYSGAGATTDDEGTLVGSSGYDSYPSPRTKSYSESYDSNYERQGQQQQAQDQQEPTGDLGECTLSAAVYNPAGGSSSQGAGSYDQPQSPANKREQQKNRVKCPNSSCDCGGIHRGEWI